MPRRWTRANGTAVLRVCCTVGIVLAYVDWCLWYGMVGVGGQVLYSLFILLFFRHFLDFCLRLVV